MSKKAQFIRHTNPNAFTEEERRNRSHLPHSVALLILSPKGDQIATAIPGSAREHGVDYVQSAPQLRMTQDRVRQISPFGPTDAHVTVQGVALTVAREFLNMRNIAGYNDQHFAAIAGSKAMKHNRLWYVGTTRGNKRVNADTVVPYGRYVHWVLMHSDRYKDVFRNDSIHFIQPQWVNTKRLRSLPQARLMSPRKLEMIDQVLLEYCRITGDYNKLVAAATMAQQEVAA